MIQNNWLSITNTYPQKPRYERDYEFQMGKSVTDKWGTRLYYHNDSMYYNLENETENEDYLLEMVEIDGYGFYNALFETPINEIVTYCESLGIPVYVWGQKLVIVQEDTTERTEIEADFDQLYFETRLFRDSVHILTDRTDYQRVSENIIPIKSKRVYYSELPSETRYQITELETYQFYRVKGLNGNTLVNWVKQNPLPFAFTVTPDPADDTIRLLFSTPLNGMLNLKMIDIEDNIVFDDSIFVDGNAYTININHLESGIYTVVCVYENDTAEADFLKEGIGLFPNINPTVMEIQILPNPATDNITVVFPVIINANMSVKIMDVMGTVHLNSAPFIFGKTLSINISSLPAGIYYITCINNSGTAYKKFIKNN